MPIDVACGGCAKRFRAGDKLAGKRVKCPQCQGVISIPVPMAEPVYETAPAPAPPPPHAPVAQSIPVAQPLGAGLAGLLNDEQLSTNRRCPSCSSLLGVNDVLCIGCGYDTRSGTQIQPTASADQAKAVDPGTKRHASSAGASAGVATASFVKGCIISLIAVTVAAVIWYVVVSATGYELGLIAWGLGIAAGAGMQVGYGRNDDMAGITAAFIACLGILIAKWIIFCNIVLPMVEQLGALVDFGDELPSKGMLFFKTCFGIMDGVFILLAFFTAYKVGSGQSET